MNRDPIDNTPKTRLAIIGLAALAVVSILSSAALAQSAEDPWSEPQNLSQSGGTRNPHLVLDSDNRVHVLWQDEFAGLMYTSKSPGAEWAAPIQAGLPFDAHLSSLKLLADPGGVIHAIWQSTAGEWTYSRISNESFGAPFAWSTEQTLTAFSPSADFAIDSQGSTHFAFVNSAGDANLPAGVYYRSSTDGMNWSPAITLFQSPYFRGLGPENAHVQVASGEGGRVFVAWDDRLQEQIHLARSEDSGQTWSPPILIDARQQLDPAQAVGPTQVRLTTRGAEALILWQAGHQGSSCAQYYQFPIGEGDPQIVSPRLDCPTDMQFINSPDGDLWLAAKNQGTVYLLAWDNEQSKWSPPQLQVALSGFSHPETFRPVELGCWQAALSSGQLHVVSCQTQAGADIWYLERPLANPEEWFPAPTPTPLWSTPAAVAENLDEISRPVMVSDPKGWLHVFWTLPGSESLIYAVSDGVRWSDPEPVLVSPGGAPFDPHAAVDPNGRIFVVWSDSNTGKLYLSHLNTSLTSGVDAWSPPESLPQSPSSSARSPKIQVDTQGRLTIAYVVPLNEGRGIYLLQSQDQPPDEGPITWSSPLTVFDAASADWSMVGEVDRASSEEGSQHLLWTHESLPPASQPIALYYARSPGAFQDWTEPQEVDKGDILWSALLPAQEGSLHRAWGELSAGRISVWHQYSGDGGETWSQAALITSYTSTTGPLNMSTDGYGRPHLTLIAEKGTLSADGNPDLELQSWIWEPGSQTWKKTAQMTLAGWASASQVSSSSAPNGLMGILFTAQRLDPLDRTPAGFDLLFSESMVSTPAGTPIPLPTFTQAPQETEGPAATPQLSPTPTLVFSTAADQRPVALFGGGRWTGIAVGALPAVLIVITAFVIVLRKMRED